MQILSVFTCICLVIDCGDPGTLSNGVRAGSFFTFGETVRYKCNHGYKLSGVSNRTCGESGRWSGDKAVCNGRSIVEKIFFDKKITEMHPEPGFLFNVYYK